MIGASEAVVVPSTIAGPLPRHRSPHELGIKVNLYRRMEVEALAAALDRPGLRDCPVECLMVGDSYFMTHLGRASTAFAGPAERAWAMDTLVGLVAEVRAAMDSGGGLPHRPFLLADLPAGLPDGPGAARAAAARFTDAGADAVKIELVRQESFRTAAAIADTGVPVWAHLGYTPQRGGLARHGDSLGSALDLFLQARRARDIGARGLVLEMVSEPVNQALSRPANDGLPVYSIFSGRARFGGQSLNVWDAVVRPDRRRRSFPPTACIDAADVPTRYTPDLIADRLGALLELTLAGDYPTSPPSRMPEPDLTHLRSLDPWKAERTTP